MCTSACMQICDGVDYFLHDANALNEIQRTMERQQLDKSAPFAKIHDHGTAIAAVDEFPPGDDSLMGKLLQEVMLTLQYVTQVSLSTLLDNTFHAE
mmetsp:Transcript_111104/g.313450  ORF Transcript_111104/g.313450 Transcript_111104/m.313450 type:complete len:96 (-) Transcript_111104:585-872(-)